MDTIKYKVDAQGLLVSVDENWSKFAVQNKAAHLRSEVVLNRYIWSFISGLEARFMYKVVLDYVRKKNESVEFPFRCDSPDRRRFLSMAISPGEDDSCLFVSTLLKEETREFIHLLDVSSVRTAYRIQICSWCKKVKSKTSHWREIEDLSQEWGLYENQPPALLHSVCPLCQDSVLALIGQKPGATRLY